METTNESGHLAKAKPVGADDVAHAEERDDKHSKVRVIYNGMTEKVEFSFNETMGALRDRAVKAFGNLPTPHLLSLHTAAGVEFGPDRDQQTIRDAGIKKNDELLLRPGVVRGGC